MLKGQDLVILAALMNRDNADETYSELGERTCLSASEAHASVKRLQIASMLNSERKVLRRNAIEFLAHGLKYAFPLRPAGMMAKGLATAYAAPIAAGQFATTGMCPVWGYAKGEVYGQAFMPLYSTAPEAAAKDPALYNCLAVFDMLRGGRLRERQFAEAKLQEILG